MDVEFHYYMTYLMAAAAGFPPDDALTIAYASQYIDDNRFQFKIDQGQPSAYTNYISQTMDITRPRDSLMRIYPLYHFVPGEPMAEVCTRLDGCMHLLNTTPGSPNATAMMTSALATDDLHRIGIAAHAFADSWAHQNFVGYFDAFNGLRGPLEALTPNIGHADAKHLPDLPTAVWQDPRLAAGKIDNRQRFLDAAEAMMGLFMTHVDPAMGQAEMGRRVVAVRQELNVAMGPRDDQGVMSEMRVGRYVELSRKPFFGGRQLPLYDKDMWLDMAVNEDVRLFSDRWLAGILEFVSAPAPLVPDEFSWRDKAGYKTSHWLRFQEAVKAHQRAAMDILMRDKRLGVPLRLPRF